jgi:hypothetical protein
MESLAVESKREGCYPCGPIAKDIEEKTMATNKVQNGVNVDALLGAREALTKAPEAAKFQWRATCKWVNGTHSRSTVEGFYGLGGEQKHKTTFSFDADHPEIFASEDKGATPVELVLAGGLRPFYGR